MEFHPNHDGCVMFYAPKVERLTTEAHNCDPTGLAGQVVCALKPLII